MNSGYYAVIPAHILHDQDLSANAKLLYGEITSLANLRGYCFAQNQHFANTFKVKKNSVTRWINELIDKEYIKRECIYKEGTKCVSERRLYINDVPFDRDIPTIKNDTTPYQKEDEGDIKNDTTPTIKNDRDNNTSINNTTNITDKDYVSNDTHQKIFDFYLGLGLVKHQKLTKEMINAIEVAKRRCGCDYREMCIQLNRHKMIVEYTKDDKEFAVRPRGLREFFGQKVKDGTQLICTEYADDGSKWIWYKDQLNKPKKQERKPKSIDLSKYGD